MTSIRTNTDALAALQSLSQTNKTMESTQNRISTGYKVASASDNAAYWSIATTMRSDNGALSTVNDALNLGASTADVAYTGMNSAIDLTNSIKQKLVAARSPGVDRTKVQSEISQLQNQLKSVADSASFSGQNLLSVDSSAASYNGTRSIVSSFTRDSAGAVTVGTIAINVDTSGTTVGTKLYDASAAAAADQKGILASSRDATTGALAVAGTFDIATLDISALTDSTADLTTLDGYIKGADAAVNEMTSAASNLGAEKSRISTQQSFVSNLMQAIDKGVGSLVDADMNEESTKLQALQVQSQLGIQSLSIANQAAQSIMKLFQ